MPIFLYMTLLYVVNEGFELIYFPEETYFN